MKKLPPVLIGPFIICLFSSFIGTDLIPVSNSAYNSEGVMPVAILRVKKSATPGGDGSSWVTPFNSLQDALDSSAMISGVVEIWVTNDTYYPDEGSSVTDNDRNSRFNISTSVEVYGGFIGVATETSKEDRNHFGTPTTLSGDIDQNDNAGDTTSNSYHVVYFDNSYESILDGFVIRGGYADGAGNDAKGGGAYNVFGAPSIRNTTFKYNYALDDGGAIHNSVGDPVIYNCDFENNSAGDKGGAYSNLGGSGVIRKCEFSNNSSGDNGGAIYNDQDMASIIDSSLFLNNISVGRGGAIANRRSTANVTHCVFRYNQAEQGGAIYIKEVSENEIRYCTFSANIADYGGALMNDKDANSTITNSLFYKNEASFVGGGIYVFFSDPILINLTIVDNIAPEGAGLRLGLTEAEVYNTIVWGDGDQFSVASNATPDVSHCLLKDGYDNGINIINENPKLINSLNEDYRLTSCSPAIDEGLNTENIDTIDLYNQNRIYKTTIDIGAHEMSSDLQVIYVDSSATGTNSGANWTDAYPTLQDALSDSDTILDCSQIWVAKGTYYPDEGIDQVNDERESRFELQPNTQIYGGFVGTEVNLDHRDWFLNPTILSGDIDQNDAAVDQDDNVYHVVFNKSPFMTPLDGSAILDGFHITGGNGDGIGLKSDGGGVYLQSASPTISNCQFYKNITDDLGGVAHIESGRPVFTNCSFYNNEGEKGGAISLQNTKTEFLNCAFFNNTSSVVGGAVYLSVFGEPEFTNCTFANNVSTSFPGGAISNSNAVPTISNCIFWNNGTEIIDRDSISIVSNSIVEGGFIGGSNIINTDPLFVEQASGNLQLLPCSPAIDQGDTTVNLTVTDLLNQPRVYDASSNGVPIIDLGAYEIQEPFIMECNTCPDSLLITTVSIDSTYRASGFIKLTAMIPAGIDIILSAPDSIIFGGPFQVISNGTVQVDSIGCEQ